MDYKTIKVGDKVTILSYSGNYPGTILNINKSGKTIVVGQNEFNIKGMGVGKGSMIKALPIKNVNKTKFSREYKFRWNSNWNNFLELGNSVYGDSLRSEWKDFEINYGR